ncbi:hypothetical protein BDN72DRAFT_896481 [Pluteus cervinus]|uniref:Uncharacterized protein n=1 Tax=Pluteus cervinus TaxID=181527 RepID=A0ACD3AYB9_9AGAR|nr:hypothetical protein BDN72DRAFT_896481 [Pluteus cervinus]
MVFTISFVTWTGLNISLPVCAAIATLFRVIYHSIHQRFSYDDYAASFALASIITLFISVWMQLHSTATPQTLVDIQSTLGWFWTTHLTFLCVVWASRVSLSFSITRLSREGTGTQRVLMFCTIIMGGFFPLALGQLLWVCGRQKHWIPVAMVQCRLGHTGVFLAIGADIISNLYLIVAPIYLFRDLNMPARQRKLNVTVFFSSGLCLVTGILYGLALLFADEIGPQHELITTLAANLEASVTLLMSNLLVLRSYIYRLISSEDPEAGLSALSFKTVTTSMFRKSQVPIETGSMDTVSAHYSTWTGGSSFSSRNLGHMSTFDSRSSGSSSTIVVVMEPLAVAPQTTSLCTLYSV